MIRQLATIASEAKLSAMKFLLGAAIGIGVTASYFGYSKWGLQTVVVPIFVYGIIWALKRELGVFGICLNLD